jgi:cellulose synthase/poly-beta-1,6-N-acetylglucosamine synthase-like glycosyltransferase
MVVFIIVVVYGILLSLVLVYGLNTLYLSYLALKHRGPDPSFPPLADYPIVTVQLPIYNERYVARRVIDAVCQMDWPRDRLEIQVLDDSTDDTVSLVAALVSNYRLQGV